MKSSFWKKYQKNTNTDGMNSENQNRGHAQITKNCFLGYMKEVRRAENRTPRVCWNSEFSGCNIDVFAFL